MIISPGRFASGRVYSVDAVVVALFASLASHLAAAFVHGRTLFLCSSTSRETLYFLPRPLFIACISHCIFDWTSEPRSLRQSSTDNAEMPKESAI